MFAMPINPSDLPWWGWLCCSVGAWMFCFMLGTAAGASGSKRAGSFGVLLALALSATGLITGAIGVLQFVKWYSPR